MFFFLNVGVCLLRDSDRKLLTRASSWTILMGILASTSMISDMEDGMASYVGCTGAGACCAAGIDAAIAAAIEVAI